MTCPHCGAETAAEQKFCQSCSRLVDSPLLAIKRELDAARGALHEGRQSLTTRSRTPLADRLAAKLASPADHSSDAHDFDRATRTASVEATFSPSWPETVPQLPRPSGGAKAGTGTRGRKKGRRGDPRHAADTHRFDTDASPQPAADALPAGWPPERFPRPPSVRVMMIVDVLAGLTLLALAAGLFAQFPAPRPTAIDGALLAAVLLGGLFLLTARLVGGLHPIGGIFQRVLAVASFAAFPFGTLYSVVMLTYFRTPGMKLLFSGRMPRQMNAKELEAVRGTLKLAPVMALALVVLAILGSINVVTFVRTMLPQIQALPALLEPPNPGQD